MVWTCSVDGCGTRADARGLCKIHYKRAARRGGLPPKTGKKSTTRAFWEMTSPEPNTGCWLWLGTVDQDGYGLAYGSGGRVRAHRFAWESTSGNVPSGLMVCHRCDNPTCVNPEHLFLGTASDNAHDMLAKGRQVSQASPHLLQRGVAKPNAKLSEEDVREMRRLHEADGIGCRRLAGLFGVNKRTALDILRRQRWRHVA